MCSGSSGDLHTRATAALAAARAAAASVVSTTFCSTQSSLSGPRIALAWAVCSGVVQ